MRIALDYDGTYTLDPYLWNEFIARFEESGHEILCVTMRYDNELERIKMPHNVNVIYTGRIAKAKHLNGLGIKIDVWIDDNPIWLYQNG